MELLSKIKNHSDFLFYPSSCNAHDFNQLQEHRSIFEADHEHRDVPYRVDDYDLTYFVFNYRISNIKIMTG